jgi:hypothetical protein
LCAEAIGDELEGGVAVVIEAADQAGVAGPFTPDASSPAVTCEKKSLGSGR